MTKTFTFRLYDEELEGKFLEWINTFPGEGFNQKMKSFVKSQVNKSPSPATKTEQTKSPSPEPSKSVIHDPYDMIKDFPRCPHEMRFFDRKLNMWYCAKGLGAPLSDRQIKYRAENFSLDRCRQCIQIHEKQKELTALVRSKRIDPYGKKAKVDWGKSEGVPFKW